MVFEIKAYLNKSFFMKAEDSFCGGGDMSYGMQEAGIDVLAGIDL